MVFTFFFFFFFFGLFNDCTRAQPRLGVKLELQLPAMASATAMRDPSHVSDLHHSSWQHQILNPLSEARDRTLILMGASQILNPLSHTRNSFTFLSG